MSRQIPPTSSKSKKSRPTLAKAIPDLEKDVNALILDYLIVFAIDAALTAEEEGQGDADESDADPDVGKGEMADWFGRVLDAFGHLPLPDHTHNADQAQGQSEMDVDMDMNMGAEMAPDLPIKIQILNILTSLRHTIQTQSQIPSQTNQSQIPAERKNLAQIGLSFMNLCLSALHKTHPAESRWMGISAEFLDLATREHAQINPTDPDGTADPDDTAHPDDISRLKNWSSSNKDMDERWNLTWKSYIARSSSTAGGAGPDAGDVKKTAISFIQDLMTTLDPPILLQLEGGKLGDLSFEETGDLLRRVGLPAGNGNGAADGDEDEDGGGG